MYFQVIQGFLLVTCIIWDGGSVIISNFRLVGKKYAIAAIGDTTYQKIKVDIWTLGVLSSAISYCILTETTLHIEIAELHHGWRFQSLVLLLYRFIVQTPSLPLRNIFISQKCIGLIYWNLTRKMAFASPRIVCFKINRSESIPFI